MILVCEHASSYIPQYFNGLGLADDIRKSHIAWDPGALELAKCLSSAFDAPLVHSRISRLVYDCNREIGNPSAMTKKSELFEVPGNMGIGPDEAKARISQIYSPFANALEKTIKQKKSRHESLQIPDPLLVTVHSFTPVYFGKKRDVEIGILHSTDRRLADEMLKLAPMFGEIRIERNQPYGPQDGVTHTLEAHGIKNGIANVMIEVRNDLLENAAGVTRICEVLFKLISLSQPEISTSMAEEKQSGEQQ